jgi:hypothetical protein
MRHRFPSSSGSWPGNKSHAIAQMVSRRLSTSEARLRSQVRSCRTCGEKSDIGSDFLRVIRFALPILIPPTAPIFINYPIIDAIQI